MGESRVVRLGFSVIASCMEMLQCVYQPASLRVREGKHGFPCSLILDCHLMSLGIDLDGFLFLKLTGNAFLQWAYGLHIL